MSTAGATGPAPTEGSYRAVTAPTDRASKPPKKSNSIAAISPFPLGERLMAGIVTATVTKHDAKTGDLVSPNTVTAGGVVPRGTPSPSTAMWAKRSSLTAPAIRRADFRP